MDNLFDALCSALSEPEIKSLFLASEGVDLMVLMMKSVMRIDSPGFTLTNS
jgi:beta-catenin-like protein 1